MEKIMKVRLADIQVNPLRDFRVDPMNEEIIEQLTRSIGEDGSRGFIR